MSRILVQEFNFYLYDIFSLKEKRRIKNMLMDRVDNKFNVSIIESAEQDNLDVLAITIAAACLDEKAAQKQEQKLREYIEVNMETYSRYIDYDFEIL